MENQEIIPLLEEIGLNDKESSIYLTLLELGQSNVTRLAQKSGVNRITSYHILASLMKKGLVSSIDKDNIQNYQAVHPNRLIEVLREKQDKIRSILPELEAKMQASPIKPTIALYEGKKGISALLDDVLLNSKEILAYGNYDIGAKAIEYQSLHFRKTRLNKKITLKAVIDKTDSEFSQDERWKSLTKIKINENLSKISTYTFIYGDKIAILTFKDELLGVIIQSPEIVNKEKFIFDLLWKIAKK